MSDEIDLEGLSREELLALVRQLQARVVELEGQLAGRGGKSTPQGMPGHKPAGDQPAGPKKRRKKRTRGYARARLVPTERVEHALDACPLCQTHLVGGSVKWTRQVIEIEIVPVRVVEHAYVERQCPTCGQGRTPPVALAGVVVGERGRLGVNLVSLIATLREVGRLPLETIQWFLATFYGLELSLGGISQVLQRVAKAVAEPVAAIREAVRASPVVCADETGWREKGKNRYLWTFATPSERYFAFGGRHKEMVDAALGEGFAGVVVCDFYAAYNHLDGLKQRCWAHLLRDIHDLTKAHPTDQALGAWAKAVHKLYERAKAFTSADPRARLRQQRRLERALMKVCAPYIEDPTAPQRGLCARVQRHLSELFVFVADPQVPSTNNAAERSLRPLVTSRKISGGTQGPQGTQTKVVLASLFGTYLARGLNPFHQLRSHLISPHP